MTTVLLDDPQIMSSANIPSRILGSERNIIRIGQKGKGLRTDSPTTIKACQDLGFLISDLKQKSLDDFKEPNIEEEITQIRFQHYMKKYNRTPFSSVNPNDGILEMIKDILMRKKQIAQKIRDDNLQQQQVNQESSSQRIPKDLFTSFSLGFRTRSTGNSPKEFKTPYSSLIPGMNKGKPNFNKTLSCFMNSHDQIDMGGIDNTLSPNDSQMSPNNPFAKLNKTLSQEIFKFNQSKVRQQKNARMRYEDELKRLEMLEEMKEKEKRKESIEKIKTLARKKSEDERKKLQEERAYKMKQLERDFRVQKDEEKRRMVIKFQDAYIKLRENKELKIFDRKKNLDIHVEERNREIAERRQEEDQKNFQAFKRRQKFSQEELERSNYLKTEISRRLFSKNQIQRANVTEVSMRAKIELNKVQEKVAQSKERLVHEEEEGMHKMIEKLQKDEDRIRKWNFEYNQSVKNKEAEQKSKQQVFMSNQKDLDNHLKQKLKSIDDKFTRNQKNIEKKKELEEKDRKLKQEIRRLKTEDKKEIQVRLERQLENQRSIILNKEKLDQERLFWIAAQKQLIQQAQINTAIQTKLEHDRMNDSVDRLTRTLYTSNSTQGFNKYQNRLLRDLYNSEEPMRFREQQSTQFENE